MDSPLDALQAEGREPELTLAVTVDLFLQVFRSRKGNTPLSWTIPAVGEEWAWKGAYCRKRFAMTLL